MPEAMLSRRALLKGSLATGALTLDPRAVLAASAPRRPEVAPGDGELPRRVLALYKSSELYNAVEGARPKTAWLNEVHAWAQMPLNWLGLVVDYHDVARGLPDEAQMGRYRGVLTWHQTEEIDDPPLRFEIIEQKPHPLEVLDRLEIVEQVSRATYD